MYQTVGSGFIEAIAQCLDLPLIIKELSGSPKAIESLEYSQTEGDEVEDLVALLQEAKVSSIHTSSILCVNSLFCQQQRFPRLRFVSTGAIGSSYQKLRVESV